MSSSIPPPHDRHRPRARDRLRDHGARRHRPVVRPDRRSASTRRPSPTRSRRHPPLVYILATLALVFAGSRGWYLVAWVAICFELVGVLVIGTLSLRAARAVRPPDRVVVVRRWATCSCRSCCRSSASGGSSRIALPTPTTTDAAPPRWRRDRLPRSLRRCPPDFGPSVVAIGKFDGVHSGHRAVHRPGSGGCRDRRRARRRGHVRPQPARAAAPGALPRET